MEASPLRIAAISDLVGLYLAGLAGVMVMVPGADLEFQPVAALDASFALYARRHDQAGFVSYNDGHRQAFLHILSLA